MIREKEVWARDVIGRKNTFRELRSLTWIVVGEMPCRDLTLLLSPLANLMTKWWWKFYHILVDGAMGEKLQYFGGKGQKLKILAHKHGWSGLNSVDTFLQNEKSNAKNCHIWVNSIQRQNKYMSKALRFWRSNKYYFGDRALRMFLQMHERVLLEKKDNI